MATKRKTARRKRGVGRPVTTGTGTLIGCRCHAALLDSVDKWRKGRGEQGQDLSRPAAIVRLAEIGLKHG